MNQGRYDHDDVIKRKHIPRYWRGKFTGTAAVVEYFHEMIPPQVVF